MLTPIRLYNSAAPPVQLFVKISLQKQTMRYILEAVTEQF